jgi:hypothetical protein
MIIRVAAALIAALLVVGCGEGASARDALTRRRTSPFAVFGRDDMRAGLRFEVLEGAARKESVRQFDCAPLWAEARSCSVRIDPGLLTALVDRNGRVIRLSVHADQRVWGGQDIHGQIIFREAVRDTRAAWDSIATLFREEADGGVRQLRWRDNTRRWGASLWYRALGGEPVPPATRGLSDAELAITLPDSIAVTDMPAYALLMQLRPPPSPTAAPRGRKSVAVVAPPLPSPDQLVTMMRSDLRALTIAQEGALHAAGRYETTLTRLQILPSPGVRLELLRAGQDGWSAVAIHPALPGRSCVVYAGDVVAPPRTRQQGRRGASPGDVVCDSL